MNEFKGTKGKWIVGKANMKDTNKDELVVSMDGGEKTKQGYRLIACISPWEKYDSIDLANALLISKAPEMLHLLKELSELKSSSFILDELQERAKQLIKEVTEL